MGCATGIVKYFVFLANLVFALAGLGLIIIGVLYKFNYSDATKALPSNFGIAPILSIIIGVIVFITAFMGCCGAVKESPCMLTTYAIILLVIFIIQVAIGVYAFLQIKDTNEFRNTIHEGLKKPYRDYTTNEKEQEIVDVTQRFLKCCGLDRTDDIKDRLGNTPRSCCDSDREECFTTSRDFHNQPCFPTLYRFMENSAQIIGGVAIGIAVIEILGAVFGLCLASSIRNHYRRNIYT